MVRFQKGVVLCSVMNFYLVQTSEHCTVKENVPVVVLCTVLIQIKLCKVCNNFTVTEIL